MILRMVFVLSMLVWKMISLLFSFSPSRIQCTYHRHPTYVHLYRQALMRVYHCRAAI